MRFTGGDLKLSKCYWTLQDYQWQNCKCIYSSSTVTTISISTENSSTVIKHVPSKKMIMLVDVPTIHYYDSVAIVLFYQDKINNYVTRLKGTNLNLQDVLFEYERHWRPSLEFAALVLTIPHSGILLAPLHKAIRQKIKRISLIPINDVWRS